MNVTNTTKYFKDFLKISNEELEEMASKAPPGAESLIFLPFLDGERVPVLPFSSGVLFGLDKRTFKTSYIARSIMEGTILNLGYGFKRMKSLGMKPTEIRATGGGAKSKLWLQIVANIFKTPVIVLKEKEGAAFGAALQSIWSYYIDKGEKITTEELTVNMVKKETKAIIPEPDTFPVYEKLQDQFNSLWQTLKKEFISRRK